MFIDIVVSAEAKAIEIIKQNTKLVDIIVEELLEKETIVLEEINYINKHLKRPAKNFVKTANKKSKQTLDKIIDDVERESKQK